MQVLLIANPVAGGGQGRAYAEALRQALERRGVETDLFLTHAAGDAREAAAAAGAVDGIGVIGGDGTVNEVLNGMGERSCWLGILPVGTANVVARELRLTGNTDITAGWMAEARVRHIDVGLCNGRRFLLGVGAGLDAAVVAAVHAHRGARSGFSRWVGPSLRTARTYAYPPIRAIADGEILSDTAQYAIVGNCRYSAGVFPATPMARLNDGLFDVCLLHKLGLARLAWFAAAVWTPLFSRLGNVIYARSAAVRLESAGDTEVPLQIDGDPAGFLPAEISVLPGALRVIAPTGKPGGA